MKFIIRNPRKKCDTPISLIIIQFSPLPSPSIQNIRILTKSFAALEIITLKDPYHHQNPKKYSSTLVFLIHYSLKGHRKAIAQNETHHAEIPSFCISLSLSLSLSTLLFEKGNAKFIPNLGCMYMKQLRPLMPHFAKGLFRAFPFLQYTVYSICTHTRERETKM